MAKAKRNISSFSTNIEDFFEASFLLIPNNQRDYSWTKNEKNKLWDDLIQCISDPKQLGHFLGAVVVVGEDDDPDEEERWEVVDGQQRLTTLTILARVLLDFTVNIQDLKIQERSIRRLEDLFIDKKTDELRIILNREPDFYSASFEFSDYSSRNTFFQGCERLTDVQKKIVEAYEIFNDKINSYYAEYDSGEDLDSEFDRMIDGLCRLFYVLLVRVKTQELAYKVFETLNQRGLKLSQADLIKNSLMESGSSDDEKNEINELWNELLDLYESQEPKKLDVTEFFQFSWSSRYDFIKKNDAFNTISDFLSKNSALKVISEVVEDARLWCDFLTGNDGVWDMDTSESQKAILDPLWKKHCAPLVISGMRVFEKDVKNLNILLLSVENFLFREGLVNSLSAGKMQEIFSKAANKLNDEGLDALLMYLAKESPDVKYQSNFKIVELSNKQSFYCLRKIEKFLLNSHDVSEHYKFPQPQSYNTHLEHIMPKKPDKTWGGVEEKSMFGDYLKRLGNHLMLSQTINSSLSNGSFDKKVSGESNSYLDSNFEVTKEFLDSYKEWLDDDKWTFDSIDRRQSCLSEKYSCSVWNFD